MTATAFLDDRKFPKRLERSKAIERLERFEHRRFSVFRLWLFCYGNTPAVAALARAESFAAAARGAAVSAGIFPALLNGFERAQLQP